MTVIKVLIVNEVWWRILFMIGNRWVVLVEATEIKTWDIIVMNIVLYCSQGK